MVVDQGQGFIPSDPTASLRGSFREWLLPEVFREAVRAINRTADGTAWLTGRQLDDLRDQILAEGEAAFCDYFLANLPEFSPAS